MKISHLLVSTVTATILMSCTSTPQSGNQEDEIAPKETIQNPDFGPVTKRFKALLKDHWNWQLKSNPTFATSLGIRDFDEILSDPSLSAYDKEIETAKSFLDQLNDILVGELSEDDQLNVQLLKLDLENQISGAEFGGKYMIMTNRGGPHTRITGLPNQLPFFKAADYQSYVSRLAYC